MTSRRRTRAGARSFAYCFACMLLAAALAAAAGMLAPAPAAAQDAPTVDTITTSDVREVRLADGSVIYGRIVSEDGARLTIVTLSGARIEVERAQVSSISEVRGRVRGNEVWPADPNRTRLFFGPTGRTLAAGEGYFGAFELFLPFIGYGATDWLTLSGGIPIIPEAMGELAYVAPKVRVAHGRGIDVSIGAFGFLSTEALGSGGLVYGVGTLGNDDDAITLGAGFPFLVSEEDSELAEDVPILILGGEHRLTRRTKLLSENYLVPGETTVGLFSAGIRFIGDRLSGDIGIAGGADEDGSLCCVPLVNFVYTFGRRP
jgi:hypothetical protein